jgi:hypothetical protein
VHDGSISSSLTMHCKLLCLYNKLLTGNDFTEEGFGCVIEYLYTTAVVGVTYSCLDSDKLQAALQAAQYFALDGLTSAAVKWAALHGVAVETAH